MSLLEKITDLISQVNNEAEKEDKRKGIDEIGGILKSAGVDDEIIRTVIKKCEELSYEESEAGTADNKKAKNADDEEKRENEPDGSRSRKEEFEEEKEVANKKAKNEEEEEKEEDEDKKEVKNKCKNSMDDVKKAIFGGSSKVESGYISKAKRLEMGNKY